MKLTPQQLEASRQPERCDNPTCRKLITFEGPYLLLEVVGERKTLEGNLKFRDREIKIFCCKKCNAEWSGKE